MCLAAHCMRCPAVLTCPHVCTAAPQMQSMHTASWTSSRWTAGAGQWTGPTSQTSEPCSLLCACMPAAAVLLGGSCLCATILLLQHVGAAACALQPEECRAAQCGGINPPSPPAGRLISPVLDRGAVFLCVQQVLRLDQVPKAALPHTLQGPLSIQGPQPQRITLGPLCHLHRLCHQCVA